MHLRDPREASKATLQASQEERLENPLGSPLGQSTVRRLGAGAPLAEAGLPLPLLTQKSQVGQGGEERGRSRHKAKGVPSSAEGATSSAVKVRRREVRLVSQPKDGASHSKGAGGQTPRGSYRALQHAVSRLEGRAALSDEERKELASRMEKVEKDIESVSTSLAKRIGSVEGSVKTGDSETQRMISSLRLKMSDQIEALMISLREQGKLTGPPETAALEGAVGGVAAVPAKISAERSLRHQFETQDERALEMDLREEEAPAAKVTSNPLQRGGKKPGRPSPIPEEQESFSLPEGCAPEEGKRRFDEWFRRRSACPRYSSLPHTVEVAAVPERQLESAPPLPEKVEETLNESVGVPKAGGKAVWEYLAGRYSEDTAELTLPLFIQKVEVMADDMGYSDKLTARAARSALKGRAFDIVLELRGSPDFDSWEAMKKKLLSEMYGPAKIMSAETALGKSKRESNETLRTFSKKIARLVQVAYYKEARTEREKHAMQAFLNGVEHAELETHLRERKSDGRCKSLCDLVSQGEVWLSLRESLKSTDKATVARVVPSDSSKVEQAPSESKPKWKGFQKKKGPKQVAPVKPKASQPAETQDIMDQLRTLLNAAKGSGTADGCRGRCWRCGQVGHRKAECPGGRVCSVKGRATCPDDPSTVCECNCTDHAHFGYGQKQCSER